MTSTSDNTAFTHRADALGPQSPFRGSICCGQPPTEVRECEERYMKYGEKPKDQR